MASWSPAAPTTGRAKVRAHGVVQEDPETDASSTTEKPSRVPEGLWVKCPDCTQIIYNKDLERTSRSARSARITSGSAPPSGCVALRRGRLDRALSNLSRTIRCSSPTPSLTAIACEDDRRDRPQRRGDRGDGPSGRASRSSSPRWNTPSLAAAWAWSWARRSPAPIELALDERRRRSSFRARAAHA